MPKKRIPDDVIEHQMRRERALSATREARLYMQYAEKALKPMDADIGYAGEQLAAALSYVKIALDRLEHGGSM